VTLADLVLATVIIGTPFAGVFYYDVLVPLVMWLDVLSLVIESNLTRR
jgi:hypothetical protein